MAAVAWTILQALGGYFIGHVLNKQSDAGKTFGLVIALLVWLHLGAQVTIYSAEINVVVTRRLWPRSLLGPPVAPADKRTLRALAKVEERSQEQHVDVEFETPTKVPPAATALATPAGGCQRASAQNSVSGDSRRVISNGHEHSPPSAGQPAQTPRHGAGVTANSRASTPRLSPASWASSSPVQALS